MTRPLQRYQRYSRKEAHDIFAPDAEFTPQRGSWGFRGIVRIEAGQSDFVLFVTFGQHAVDYAFDESINEDGVLNWQSEPAQRLKAPRIQELIRHDHLLNAIHLFLRTSSDEDYVYYGKLAYITHDKQREKPVHFKWQILEWDLSPEEARSFGLELVQRDVLVNRPHQRMEQTSGPSPTTSPTVGSETRHFIGRHVDFAENESRRAELGRAGELLVIEQERMRLVEEGRPDLADKVRHVSKVEGDGAGYDIESYNTDGSVRRIEVKTTRGGARTPFLLSANELSYARTHRKSYVLYRLYEFCDEPRASKFFVLNTDELLHYTFTPTHYRVKP